MARSKEALLAEELGVMQELPECFGMSTESNRMLLKHHLKKLRLPTIRREWEAAAASCVNDGRNYGDFLLQLTEREPNCSSRSSAWPTNGSA